MAKEKGYFAEEGLELKILPYSGANTDVLVAQGKADLGVSFVPQVLVSRASGIDVKAVAAIASKNTESLAVLDELQVPEPQGPGHRHHLRRLRPALRGPDVVGGHRRGRRHGHRLQERHPQHGGLRGAVRQEDRLVGHLRRLGGHRGQAARHQAADLPDQQVPRRGRQLPVGHLRGLRQGDLGQPREAGEVPQRDLEGLRVRGREPGRVRGDPDRRRPGPRRGDRAGQRQRGVPGARSTSATAASGASSRRSPSRGSARSWPRPER